jgi:SAM-dependent methyltransferase
VTLPPSYFDDLYRHTTDPWSFRTRWYEERKRAVTLASLPDRHYGSAFEPGCSNGALTSVLAPRCDRLLAMDVTERAVDEAGATAPANVVVERGAVPADWPDASFDLVVVSELGYYLDHDACRRLMELAVASAGTVVAVHWRHPVAEYPLSGDEVHAALAGAAGSTMGHLVGHREADFVLDVWSTDRRSPARREGVPGSWTP